MNNLLILAIGAGAYLLLKHGPVVRALLSLDFSYSAMDIVKIENDNLYIFRLLFKSLKRANLLINTL